MSQVQGPGSKSSQEQQKTVRDKVHSGDRVGDKAIYLHRSIQEGQPISQDNMRQDLAQVNLQYCTC